MPTLFKPDMPIGQALSLMSQAFFERFAPDHRAEARYCMQSALELEAAQLLLFEHEKLGERAGRLEHFCAERLAGVPLAYLVGKKDFYGLEFVVSPDVLIPRADSETLVECVLNAWHAPDARVLDLGTGSGALLLSLLHTRPEWCGVGVDRSQEALEIAQTNARALGLHRRAQFVCSDWFENIEPQVFDIIISNPPYISEAEAHLMSPETQYEPAQALFAAQEGLACYKAILDAYKPFSRTGTLVAFEMGFAQADALCAIVAQAGIIDISIHQDLAGLNRVVMGRVA